MDSQELIGGHGLRVKAAMMDLAERLLQVVGESAQLKRENYFDLTDDDKLICVDIWEEGGSCPSEGVLIDKNSIINIINEIEQ